MATQAERREKTRAAIVKAAKRIFGERGFAATTMDDIAGAARVAKGAVYHHFTTKEALFETVFEQGASGEGIYPFVTHSFADAEKGAVGLIQVGTPKHFTTMTH